MDSHDEYISSFGGSAWPSMTKELTPDWRPLTRVRSPDKAAPHAVKTAASAAVTRLAAKPAKREAVPARKAVAAAVNGRRGGPVGRMQAAVATALAQDKDWQEF